MNQLKLIAAVAVFGYSFAVTAFAADKDSVLRPPAVPLVTSDPYLSVWSEADRLTDDVTRHWTHHEHSLVSMIRIDGKSFRLMGREPKGVPAMPQTRLQVLPMRSIYDFDDGHVHITLTFMTPALPHDLEVLTRPLTYITWQVRSQDRAEHSVSIYDSVSSQLAVNSPDQQVLWARETLEYPKEAKPTLVNGGKVDDLRETMGNLTALRVGTVDQPVLAPPVTILASIGAMFIWLHPPFIRNRQSARKRLWFADLSSMAIFLRTTMPASRER